jgi:hypothetical protein
MADVPVARNKLLAKSAAAVAVVDEAMLDESELAFVRLFTTHYNITLAAKELGLTPAQARHMRLRPVVAAYIAQVQQEQLVERGLRGDRILDELLAIGLSNIGDYVSWDDKGEVRFKPSDEISERALAAIGSITSTRTVDVDGNVTYTVKLDREAKTAALNTLVKHLGLVPQGGVNVNVNVDNRRVEIGAIHDLLDAADALEGESHEVVGSEGEADAA